MERLLNLQDQYKFPMGQLIYEQEPEAEVTFALTNRLARLGMRLADYINPDELQEYYDNMRQAQFQPSDIDYLKTQTDKNYTANYLGYLATFRLPEIEVTIDANNNDITAKATANWNDSSMWEIPMLASLPELYYPKYIESRGATMEQVWAEGDHRLTNMIELFRQYPDLKFAEFGTRRRFSSDWQDHAVERFASECPDNFIGTSNPYLARKHHVSAVGTNAHELGMTYAALAEQRGGNPLNGSAKVIEDWLERFPKLPVALIDTFTSDAALHDLTLEQIETIQSYRIDSGDEYQIGHKVIDFLQAHGIDPQTRSLFFSNSLTPQKCVELHQYFAGKIKTAFGIGGHAVNNMGLDSETDLPKMNVVAKAVRVNGQGTVKLSDDPGKYMGQPDDIRRYQDYLSQRLG